MRIAKASPVLALAVLLFSSGALAQEKPTQPYIELLKKGIPAEPPTEGTESYIESVRRKLGPSTSEESYIEKLKKTDPKAGEAPPAESYIERIKRGLKPLERPSAIAAFKEGRSEVQARREGKIKNAVGIRLGFSQNRDITGESSAVTRSFNDFYGNSWAPDLTVFYEFQPFHSEWFGNIGVVLGFELLYFQTTGKFSTANPNGLPNAGAPGTYFGAESHTKFRFMTVPVFAGLNYRFNLFRVLRPYAQVTPTLVGYYEMRSDNVKDQRGYTKGLYFSGGLNVLLDWMAPSYTWSLYEAQNVKHFYLTIDYSRLTTFGGDLKYALSGLSAGLTYEF